MIRVLFWSIFVFLFCQCANPVSPTGGPRDEQPPRILNDRSTPNLSTNFKENEVLLVFDEWVELNDAFNQVIITPPLQETPEVKLTRKKGGVLVQFNERLRDSTTYTIYFGESVRDITERNIVPNLRFVFSTGPVIDSLEVSGTVINSTTGKEEPDMLVMLYENPYDSIVYKEKPIYFSKTDKSGKFRIENMKGGSYQVFGLIDANFNYLYDLDSEAIAFLEEEVNVTDSTTTRIELKSFEGPRALSLKESNTDQYGLLELEFNKDPLELNYELINPGIRHFFFRDREKLNLYYESDTLRRIYVQVKGEELDDTLQYRVRDREIFLKTLTDLLPEGKKVFNGLPESINDSVLIGSPLDSILPVFSRRAITPGQVLEIRFNRPIQTIDSSRMAVFRDTMDQAIDQVQFALSDDRKGLLVDTEYRSGSNYYFLFEKGSLIDWYDQAIDSLIVKEKANDPEDYGTLILSFENLDSTRNYLVDLIGPSQEILTTFQIKELSSYQETFPFIEPGIITVRITEDTNKNGRWDTGSYPKKRQPEQVYETKLSDLRANWELEATVNLKALK